MSLTIESIWTAETQQTIFRSLLDCMSLPGTIRDLSSVLGNASPLVGVLATLLDNTVTWSDDDHLVKERDRHFLNTPLVSSNVAQFVVKNAAIPPDKEFYPQVGELTSPETGATLILQGNQLGKGDLTLELTGPGIETKQTILLDHFHLKWFLNRQQWNVHFPLGIDLILVDKTNILAIPRTTQITIPDA